MPENDRGSIVTWDFIYATTAELPRVVVRCWSAYKCARAHTHTHMYVLLTGPFSVQATN